MDLGGVFGATIAQRVEFARVPDGSFRFDEFRRYDEDDERRKAKKRRQIHRAVRRRSKASHLSAHENEMKSISVRIIIIIRQTDILSI